MKGVEKMISIFDMFKIGIGPSSSHTVGPMRAGVLFRKQLIEQGLLDRITRFSAHVYGSLSFTGKGHGTDHAIIGGLAGYEPDTVDTTAFPKFIDQVLRSKTLTGEALRREIRRAIAATSGSHSQLFINDHWQLALEEGAYGVHLGQEDMDRADFAALARAGIRLGLSTHDEAEMARALAVQPSYVACGAVFATHTKAMPTEPQGLDKLRRYVQQAGNTPTVAIGGITLENAPAVLATGVSSLAVVSAVTHAPDPAAAVRAFQKLWPE